MSVMERVVFAAGGRAYRWADVIAAAEVRGEWAAIGRDATAERASASRTVLSGWRREQRLLSADETVAWLEYWDLELGDVEWYLGIRSGEPGSGTGVDRPAWVQAACSGAHERLAFGLAARVALAPDPPRADAVLDFAALQRLDGVYEEQKLAIEARDVARLACDHAAEWLRARLVSVTLTDRDVAREAALCVRLDGTPLHEVAAMAGADVVERTAFVDDLDPERRARVVGAALGEVIGPLATDAGHCVIQVVAKYTDADDPEILARAGRVAVDQAIARASVGVEWRERF